MKKIILLFAVLASFTATAQEDCNAITMEIMEQTGSQKFTTSGVGGVTFTKFKSGDQARYMFYVRYANVSESSAAKGVTLFLENGKEINRPDAKVRVYSTGERSFVHEAVFEPTEAELKLLLESKIVKKTVYTFSKDVAVGDQLREQLICMVAK